MLFANIIGQEHIKSKMIQSVREGRISHAIMLLGQEGSGGLPLALAYAQYMHCENPTETDSCGQCSACGKVERLIHPDLHFMFPNIKKDSKDTQQLSAVWMPQFREMLAKNPYMSYFDWINFISGGENKQGNITKGDCHEVIKHLSLKSFEGKWKIQVIWLAEYLGEAGNILLKIVEEPPEDTLFIMVVENSDMVLNTILSRTQIIKVPALQDEEIQSALENGFEVETDEAMRISRIADGNFNAARQLAEGGLNLTELSVLDWFKALFRKALRNDRESADALLGFSNRFAEQGREKQKNFIRYSLFFIRETMRLMNGFPVKMDGEEADYARRMLPYLDAARLNGLQKTLGDLHYYIERNGNPKSQMMSASIKMSRIFASEFVREEDF